MTEKTGQNMSTPGGPERCSVWRRINFGLVSLCLIAVVLWGLSVSAIGVGYIYTVTRPEAGFARIPADVAVDRAIRVFVVATVWIPVAVVSLVRAVRARQRPHRLRGRIRQAWLVCVAFVAVSAVYLLVGCDSVGEEIVGPSSIDARYEGAIIPCGTPLRLASTSGNSPTEVPCGIIQELWVIGHRYTLDTLSGPEDK